MEPATNEEYQTFELAFGLKDLDERQAFLVTKSCFPSFLLGYRLGYRSGGEIKGGSPIHTHTTEY